MRVFFFFRRNLTHLCSRQHNQDTSISQEFYIWASVTEAAKYALDIR